MFQEGAPAPDIDQTVEAPSRFGNKSEILTVLDEAPVESIHNFGSLKEVYAQYSAEFGEIVPEHSNVVELVEMMEKIHGSGQVLPVEIDTGSKHFYAIFKPINGESTRRREEYDIPAFAPNEQAAYLVSEHFGLDLVPPTTLRELPDKGLGSLQFFLDPFHHGLVGDVIDADNRDELLRSNPDYQALAVFDWLILNCDRNNANYFIDAELKGSHADKRSGGLVPRYELGTDIAKSRLYAIDNGFAFSEKAIRRHSGRMRSLGGIPGPSRGMTVDIKTVTDNADQLIRIDRQPRPATELPGDLRDKLELGLKNRQLLQPRLESIWDSARSREIISDHQHQEMIDETHGVWKRASQLLEKNCFLSLHNTERP